MATVYPFRALRPRPADAAAIAAVPYDVVDTEEARALADGNPLSFLRVSRAEIELPPGTHPYADVVYERAASNFAALTARSFLREAEPSVYAYRLRMGAHAQTGVAACYSLDEYDRDIIRKHERTREDKEADRTRHMIALSAQTGPVFLTFSASAEIRVALGRVMSGEPLYDFQAPDGVHHTLWRAGATDRDALCAAFGGLAALYIADGHHRAASAARARTHVRERRPRPPGSPPDAAGGAETMLGVAFPHDEVQILPYNRIVRDLGPLSGVQFLEAVQQRFAVGSGPPTPGRRGEVAMYFQGEWRTLTARRPPDRRDAVASLDVSVLQDNLLAPILGIADVRTDKRIEFVGGARGTAELQRLVDSGRGAVAFSLFPVSVADLMAVSDAGAMMPPKSTWFEPKLRDGLLIHLI
jgi:uncharacterized protein (DUF1015 family)